MIKETIDLIVNNPNYAPSTGDNLVGMEFDIQHAFESNQTFEKVSIVRTGDKRCMFQINLTVATDIENLYQISNGLQEAWGFI